MSATWAATDLLNALAREEGSLLVEPALFGFLLAALLGTACMGGMLGGLIGLLATALPFGRDALAWILKWAARLATIVLVVTVFGIAVQVAAAPDGRERRMPPGPSTTEQRPNIVLIVIDSLRQDALERAFRLKKTPCMMAFSKTASTFSQHRSISSWTRPSISGLLTGLYPTQLGTHTASLSSEPVMLAERLHEVGYETAGVSDNYLTSHLRGFGQGHDYYWQKNNKVTLRRTFVADLVPERWLDLFVRHLHFLYSGAPNINAEALGWFERRDPARPFYLYLHYMDVHYPYYVYEDHPENESNQSTAETFVPYYDVRRNRSDLNYPPFADLTLPQPQIDDFLARYYGSIEYIDQPVCEIFEMLKASDQWDETLVIVTSDHGEEFFEHFFVTHGSSLYDESVRVPLMIKWPHQTQGFQIRNNVSGVQLSPTILEAAGISVRDLQPPISPEVTSGTRVAFSEFDRRGVSIVSAASGPLKALFSETNSGRKLNELFDLASDPGEKVNLWDTGHPEQPLIERSLEVFRDKTRHKGSFDGVELTPDDIEALKALGYY